jgi:hypothetical protein
VPKGDLAEGDLAEGDLPPGGVPPDASPAKSRFGAVYRRLLVGAAVAALGWAVLPKLPHEQTVIFALGRDAAKLSQLEVLWETEGQDHQGRLLLNFDSTPPDHVVRQFRLADGEYEFRVAARWRDTASERTEVTRRVRLEGSTVTLRCEELTQ